MSKNPTYARNREQREEDFELCVKLRGEGFVWIEIYNYINKHRPYQISLDKLKEDYYKKSKEFSSSIEENAKKLFDEMIDDCDAIMSKAIKGFNESIGNNVTVINKGNVTKQGRYSNSFRTIKEMMSQGDTKFLDMYLKAMDRKVDLLNKMTTKKIDVESFVKLLQGNPIDDDFGIKSEPIRSESTLRNQYPDEE
jgi:hypothetical protein